MKPEHISEEFAQAVREVLPPVRPEPKRCTYKGCHFFAYDQVRELCWLHAWGDTQ